MGVNMKINEKSLKKLGLKLINIRKKPSKRRESISKLSPNEFVVDKKGNLIKGLNNFQPSQFQPSTLLPLNVSNLNTEIARQQLRYYENLNKPTPPVANDVPFIPDTNKLKNQIDEQYSSTSSVVPVQIKKEPPFVINVDDDTLSYKDIYPNTSNITPFSNRTLRETARVKIPKEDDISKISINDTPNASIIGSELSGFTKSEIPETNEILPQKKLNIVTRENTFEDSSVVPVQIKREPFINEIDDDDEEKEEKEDDVRTLIDEPFDNTNETIPIKKEKTFESDLPTNFSSLSQKDVDDSIQRAFIIQKLQKKYSGYLSLYKASNQSLIEDFEFLAGKPPPANIGRVALQKEIKRLIKSKVSFKK
jgi:hypothetical protein